MDMDFIKILLTVLIRLFAGVAGYWTVVRRLVAEREKVPPHLRSYNTKLIISVLTFIITCFGTSLFQVCRVGWIPNCSPDEILDDIALFNSIGLLAAWYVMDLMVKYKPKMPATDSQAITEIKDNVREVKKDVKIVKRKIK